MNNFVKNFGILELLKKNVITFEKTDKILRFDIEWILNLSDSIEFKKFYEHNTLRKQKVVFYRTICNYGIINYGTYWIDTAILDHEFDIELIVGLIFNWNLQLIYRLIQYNFLNKYV